MKKNLFYLFALICSMSLFTACSDDDDASPADVISKEYKDAELSVTNAGEEVPSGTVKIEAIDKSNVKVTLTNVVNGFASFDLNAAVTEVNAEYTFQGEKNVDGMKVALKGLVKDGKAAIEASVEITSAEILKSWNFLSGDFINPTLIFNIENKSGKVMYYGNEEPEEMDVAEWSGGISMMGGGVLAGAFSEDFAFTFNKNGYVGIKGKSNFSPEGSQNVDIPKLARYYYNPTTKVLIFDAPIAGLLGSLTEQSSTPKLDATIRVPFLCTFDGGKMKAIVDPAFLLPFVSIIPTGETLDGLLGMLDSVMPEDLIGLLPWVKGNVKTIAYALTDKDLTGFTLGCNLSEAKK